MSLLRRYYKSAVLGWSIPRSHHWAKIVDADGFWRWTKSHQGVRGRFLTNPPVHVYQTVCGFRMDEPPRGYESRGYFLGGPLIFDADLTDKREPFSLWRLIDSADMVRELDETLADRGEYHVTQVLFSGMRGIHVLVKSGSNLDDVIQLNEIQKDRTLIDHIRERMQTARAIGKWCRGWDWTVSQDIWRVSRVPWSIHGFSALRATPLQKPYTATSFRHQLQSASPFSLGRRLRVRMTKTVPLFTFIDGETYGPFRKGWATKLPIAVALHLIWQNLARPREEGPVQAGAWFDRGWQILFRQSAERRTMVASLEGAPTV